MKKFLLCICFLIVLFSASCGVFKTYKDTNGDDNYTLQQITEDMIINKSGGLQISAVSSKTTKNGITNISLRVGEFNGIDEVHIFKSGSYIVTLNYNVTSGNTRLVITDGRNIIKDFKINGDNQVFEFTCERKYYLKLAGESCEFDLSVEIKNK